MGGLDKGRAIGGFGRLGVFGFYPNKQITTGEGGMIVTDDDRLAELCKSYRNQGRGDMIAQGTPGSSSGLDNRTGSWLAHERLGYNYRLSEINCALGISQMERLDEFLIARRRVASHYINRLMDFEDLILPNIEDHNHMSWFVFVVRLSDRFGQNERDRIINDLHRHEIGASNYFPCIHLQPFYRERFGFSPGMFPISESVSQRTLALPFYNQLDEHQIELVTLTLKVMLDRERLLKKDR